MNIVAIAFRYLWSRPLAAALNLLLSLGLASTTFVLLTAEQMDRAFERNLADIDVVVGAKGSPMQLILAGVFHIDVPPGNISLAVVQALQKTPAGGAPDSGQPGCAIYQYHHRHAGRCARRGNHASAAHAGCVAGQGGRAGAF